MLILVPFVWSGLIIGISFLEAPLKFQAPNITLVLGLGIGNLVFSILNKVEIGLATLIFISSIIEKTNEKQLIMVCSVVIILAIQSVYLLPLLSHRVILLQQGLSPEPSRVHILYIGFEILKLILLTRIGILKVEQIIKRIEP
jgi:hypothetical protein